jgi:hypothetical protein
MQRQKESSMAAKKHEVNTEKGGSFMWFIKYSEKAKLLLLGQKR